MKIFRCALALSLGVLAAPQVMACFTVYNNANQAVYSGIEPPIDMSYQIHEKLPAAFPGGHMVFGTSTAECPALDARKVSPLLSNVSFTPAAAPARSVRQNRSAARVGRAAREREADALQK